MDQKITVNGKEYIEAGSIDKLQPIVVNKTDKVSSVAIGKHVIVRSYNAGVHAGFCEAADETGIVLKGAIRLWYHKPQNNSSAWYEGVCRYGISEDSKTSIPKDRAIFVEKYEADIITEDVYNQIKAHKPQTS